MKYAIECRLFDEAMNVEMREKLTRAAGGSVSWSIWLPHMESEVGPPTVTLIQVSDRSVWELIDVINDAHSSVIVLVGPKIQQIGLPHLPRKFELKDLMWVLDFYADHHHRQIHRMAAVG